MFETSKSMLSVSEVMALIYEIGGRIGLTKQKLSSWASPSLEGPYIASDYSYCWIVMERGSERERRRTNDLDELLYWVFEGTAFDLAVNYELHHRNPKEDCRRLIFRHQLELLGNLDSAWRDRAERKIDALLENHPYCDPH
jgi:hypothetical protein